MTHSSLSLSLAFLLGCGASAPREESTPEFDEAQTRPCDPQGGSPLTEPDFIQDTAAHVPPGSCAHGDFSVHRRDLPMHFAASSNVEDLTAACGVVDASCQGTCVAQLAAEVGRRLYFETAASMYALKSMTDQHEECGELVASAPDVVEGEAARQIWECALGELPARISIELRLADERFQHEGTLHELRRIEDVRTSGRFVPPIPGFPDAQELRLSFQEQGMGCGASGDVLVLADHRQESPGSTTTYCVEGPNVNGGREGTFRCVLSCGDSVESCEFQRAFVPAAP